MISLHLRQRVLTAARRVVVKMGTAVVTGKDGRPDQAFLEQIAGQIAGLRKRGVEVTVVSSGAIGSGLAELGLERRPKDVSLLQAVAAVGQSRLMSRLQAAFDPHGLKVAQVLLTRGDFEDRVRYLNLRNCITRLHQLGCVPIVNENDTVSVEELRFGDNDMLSAMLCHALRADALVILTVVDGLLDAHNKRVDLVEDVTKVLGMVRKETSHRGVGGMIAKLEAARLVTGSGEIAVVANGRAPGVLLRLFEAADLGTVFVPAQKKLSSRLRWIGLTKRPAGTLAVDDGAVTAITKRGKSLLPSGITATTEHYKRGDVVRVVDAAGREIARGLTNYGAEEVKKIMGKQSGQLETTLGRKAYTEVIHRGNMIVVGMGGA